MLHLPITYRRTGIVDNFPACPRIADDTKPANGGSTNFGAFVHKVYGRE